MTTARQPQPHLQTKETFITLYNTRLFTAEQVWEMAQQSTHTSPPAPAPDEKCPHWKSSANLKSDCRDQGIGRFYCAYSMYEHDAQVAKAAREQVLKELYRWVINLPDGVVSIARVELLEKIEESLRAQQAGEL